MTITCRNGQNEFGCKYPDCICEPLSPEEKAQAFANRMMADGHNVGPLTGAQYDKYVRDETMQVGQSIGDKLDEISARIHFEAVASDPTYKFARSRKGTYVNPAVARDWKWFQLGIKFKDQS